MKRLLLFGVAAFALAAAVPATAAQTFSGASGLIDVPSAATLEPMDFAAAADYVNTDDFFLPLRLEFGLIEGLELGALFQYQNDADDNLFGVNLKYRIPVDLRDNLTVAAGGGFGIEGDFTIVDLYGVATYAFAVERLPVAATGGLEFLRVSDGDDSESGLGLMLGLEVGVPAVKGLSVVVEYDGENGDVADSSAGAAVRYTVRPGLVVQAGFKEFGDMEMFAGVQYSFSR